MGRVADTFGVRGWLKVAPQRGSHSGLAAASEWWIGAQRYAVEAARMHGAMLLGKLSGIETRERAGVLKGSTVAVRRASLPEADDGRYYVADLLGLEVLNEAGEALGVVKRAFSNGAHEVIEVVGSRTRLIPWVAAVVKRVDMPKRRVYVEWGADW